MFGYDFDGCLVDEKFQRPFIAMQIFLIFLKLGLISFGGPIAHLGFFHHEFVFKRKWMSDQEYADLVALCQMLPGPASSQVGMAIGFYRRGILGSVLAWAGFTLPSALLLVLFAFAMVSLPEGTSNGWLHGLKIAAVAVVAQAVWEMAKKFCSSFTKVGIAFMATIGTLYFQTTGMQISLIILGAILGGCYLKPETSEPGEFKNAKYSDKTSSCFLVLFFALLLALPLAASIFDSFAITLASVFYRIGSLVFGGGHVVLPLMQSALVDPGWISKEVFVAGYGAAQAVPGPLFSVSAYLGFMCDQWRGAVVSLLMIFLPSFLLVIGILPFWERMRLNLKMKAALLGVNAIVVGLLLAAFYTSVWTAAIFTWLDFAMAMAAFMVLLFKKAPSSVVVIVLAIVSAYFDGF